VQEVTTLLIYLSDVNSRCTAYASRAHSMSSVRRRTQGRRPGGCRRAVEDSDSIPPVWRVPCPASAATRHKNLPSDVSPKPVAPFQILVPTLQNYSNRFFGFCTIGARRQRNAKNLSWGPERLNNYSDVVGKFAISADPHRPLRDHFLGLKWKWSRQELKASEKGGISLV
jgi:hypothetical protein